LGYHGIGMRTRLRAHYVSAVNHFIGSNREIAFDAAIEVGRAELLWSVSQRG